MPTKLVVIIIIANLCLSQIIQQNIVNNEIEQIIKIISINSAKKSMSSEGQPSLDDMIKALPIKEKVPVVALKKLLDEREAIDQQQQKQIFETKMKYQKLIQPLLQRASQIIRGGAIQPHQVAGAQQLMKAGQKVADYLKGKTIDGYWFGVLSNSALVDDINQKDQKALGYLLDIQKVNDANDVQSIQLKFTFKPNPFFKQTEVRRRLQIKNGEVLCLEGDTLTWKQNQCLTHTLKKVTNKKTGQKTTMQAQKIKSFFDIFLNWDKKDQEMLSRVAENISQISSLLILDSVDYFLGVINADEQSYEEDDEDDQEEDQNDKDQ